MTDATDPVGLARALVRCRTVTPDAGSALDLLQETLGGLGFTCHRLPFGAGGPAPADNLYARVGEGAPCILLAGHVDVVPPGDEAAWRFPPFAGEIAEARLWGRGAADMKSGVAAIVAAVARTIAGGRLASGSVALLITGDEEGPALNGTDRVLAWAEERGERFDAAIVAEPTSRERLGDHVKVGRRGSMVARLLVRGRQGHTAYPARADNAAHRLVRALAAVLAEPIDRGTPSFEPSHVEIASVDVGNPATNVIPGAARATLNIRFNDRHTPESLARWLHDRIAPEAPERELAVTCNALPFVTEPGPFTALVARAVEEVTGTTPNPDTLGGTSDARFIRRLCPVVELGLRGTTLHQVDEHVLIEDIEGLTRIFEVVLGRLGEVA